MGDFRQLAEDFWASPQIDEADVAQAALEGFAMVINNRPDDEEAGQPTGEQIAAAALGQGLGYCTIPVGAAGFTQEQVNALSQELSAGRGKILAYCRSGTRSTLLWALVRASLGDDPEDIARSAGAAGYDVSPIRSALAALAARAGPGEG